MLSSSHGTLPQAKYMRPGVQAHFSMTVTPAKCPHLVELQPMLVAMRPALLVTNAHSAAALLNIVQLWHGLLGRSLRTLGVGAAEVVQ